MTIEEIISNFGEHAKQKLSSAAVHGEPEDQLRAPFETLLRDVAELASFSRGSVVPVGESSLRDLKTRPDYAVTVRGALAGFAELKAPTKGADPRAFTAEHDMEQWKRLQSLPNLLYSDGNAFSLWQNGELVDRVYVLEGDVRTSGRRLKPVPGLMAMFEAFLNWRPLAPRNARELAHTAARLCRLLRDEVTEQMALGREALTALAADWRNLLFPEATDERFADGYAQAVTFGLLMARAKDIPLEEGLEHVAIDLSRTNSLIGEALRLLTGNNENQNALKTSLSTLTRVLGAVQWQQISRDDPEAWLYFYEEFLDVYDHDLRKQTGSYYTPPEVVEAMVGLVDQALKSPKFGRYEGLASSGVTLADPAMGTGTFLLGVLRRIAQNVNEEQGPGAVPGAVEAALGRLVGFEIQLGPFAVAQLRILAEIVELCLAAPRQQPRLFVTDTLGDPYDTGGYFPSYLPAISRSRREANRIKESEEIMVVLGNPPYLENAERFGGWVAHENPNSDEEPPIQAWMSRTAYDRHLHNLYIYFWRWATWKVFEHGPGERTGVVCFITAAGFLGGRAFQEMRSLLRTECDEIFVIDCSPEGHRPAVSSRIFEGVQQPICIMLALRSPRRREEAAIVRFHALPTGEREVKFAALKRLRLTDTEWLDCPSASKDPFRPRSSAIWNDFVAIEDTFGYHGTGVMPGRTWIIAPDRESLTRRWQRLLNAPAGEKDHLFFPHMRHEQPGDKHVNKIVAKPLFGYPVRRISVADESGLLDSTAPYSFRSFDRQWIIPDSRVINQPNPYLWQVRSTSQIFAVTCWDKPITNGPAITFSGHVPDSHAYNGRGGRVFPLWSNAGATEPNIKPALLSFLSLQFESEVTPEDLMAYFAAVAANPSFTQRFAEDLSTPGLRIPITAEGDLFREASQLGRRILWLYTFGERLWSEDTHASRPMQPPRLPEQRRPIVPEQGRISTQPREMPDTLDYDAETHRLLIGHGYIEHVTSSMWNYEVSGMRVLQQWFSYRKLDRNRPQIGDRRPPSPLSSIQPDHWLPEYTTDLLDLLNVLGLLIDLEPAQATLLENILEAPLINATTLHLAGALSADRNQSEPPLGPLFAG